MSDSSQPHAPQPTRQEYWSGLPLPSPHALLLPVKGRGKRQQTEQCHVWDGAPLGLNLTGVTEDLEHPVNISPDFPGGAGQHPGFLATPTLPRDTAESQAGAERGSREISLFAFLAEDQNHTAATRVFLAFLINI